MRHQVQRTRLMTVIVVVTMLKVQQVMRTLMAKKRTIQISCLMHGITLKKQ